MPKSNEPFVWSLFSAGGVVAALLVPVHILLLGILVPLRVVGSLDYDKLVILVQHPLTKVYLFVLISLPLFHWAHRFRYTLYDGLKLKHLNMLVAVLCYGTAVALSVVAARTLLYVG